MKRTLTLSAACILFLMAVGFGCGEKKPDANDPNAKQNAVKQMPGAGGGGGGAGAGGGGGAGGTGGSRGAPGKAKATE